MRLGKAGVRRCFSGAGWARPSLRWALAHTPGTTAGPNVEWHELPASPAFCRCWRRTRNYSQRRDEARALTKFREERQADHHYMATAGGGKWGLDVLWGTELDRVDIRRVGSSLLMGWATFKSPPCSRPQCPSRKWRHCVLLVLTIWDSVVTSAVFVSTIHMTNSLKSFILCPESQGPFCPKDNL